MISVPSHRYRAEGRASGHSSVLIDRALVQASAVERNGAPSILTLRHLANRIDMDYGFLRQAISDVKSEFYRTFWLRKRKGGFRQIVVPEVRLMAVQRWIAREILKGQPVDPISHAYSKQSSIFKCAEQHVGAGWLIKLDIHDYFESISERRVYEVFRMIGYQPLVAFELARLCTRVWIFPPSVIETRRMIPNAATRGIAGYQRHYTGYLPQGAPSSPMLSNLVSRKLDADLGGLAMEAGLVVTRYSDDITFSAPADSFDRDRVRELIRETRRVLMRHEFRLHERKIGISPPGARKIVLGLLVDGERPRLTREMRIRIADHVRGIDRFGVASHMKVRKFQALSGMIAHIDGLLRFAAGVEPEFSAPLNTRFRAALQREGVSPPM